ncbi:MAG: polysaccharide biosynthesis/export family protein [Bacteroidota bacterium]
MKLIRTLLLLALPLYLLSCGTQQRVPYYLETVTDSSGKGDVLVTELRIQKNDILSIQVYSASTKPEADEIFNLRTTGTGSQGANTGGFLVDAKGNIEYPRLGTFHAEGLTKDELAAQIKKRLTEPVELLSNPSVIIRFQNLKITVMGEVASQGLVSMPGEHVTILEAVGLAGGITEYGLRNAVKVIRETDGKREIGLVNLSSDSLFQSPYYNLMQNDVVLVQPTKRKEKKADQDVLLQRVSLGLTLITAVALLYNIFR